jgi:hypothetical protein
MKVPYIPKRILKHGIKPASAGTERLFDKEKRAGLHLAGFDVETIGTTLFKSNDLYSVQIVMDSPKDSHIFFPEKQGVENLEMFTQLIDPHSKRVFATAHNAGFDIGALLGKDVFSLMKGEEVRGWSGKVVEGTCCFALLRNKSLGKSITIADSMAWYKASLKKIAEKYLSIDMQKLERPDYLGKRAPRTKKEFKAFVDYAEQDALIQFELTKRIYRLCLEGRVKMSLTPAQLSGRVFQKHYLKDRLFLPHYKLLPFIAKTYHGAQFTAFGRGFFEKVNYYDINSLYPYATINVPLNFSNTELEKLTLEKIESGFSGFVGVRFKFPEKEKYPCLPAVKEIAKFPKLVFPRSGLSYCTTEEINTALKKDVEILGLWGYGWYPEQQDINHPLAEYMLDIYRKKEELDRIKEKEGLGEENSNKRDYYKLLLNSLIGKFCQRNRDWITGKETAGGLFKPEFGSLILSKSRAIINSLISKHGAIYSDTDCLLTKHSLETGTGIGQLKNELGEGKTGDLLSIRSKLYFITDKGKLVKCAKHGFRLSSKNTFEELLKKQKSSSVSYSVTRLVKLKEAYKRNRLPRREVNQTFRIMLQEDGKREYFDRLSTVEDLLNNSTLSQPLQN